MRVDRYPFEVSRDVVEQTAHIIGPESACAQALAKAETMTDPVFISGTMGALIVIERAEAMRRLEASDSA